MKKASSLALISVLITFFTMGFVDLVGVASNFVKKDFGLTDAMASLPMTMVFVWFFVLGIPTGMLMNKIGRKKTVLLSLIVTLPALILPFFGYSFEMMLISFCLLGMGNAIMQVSLNPLIASIVSDDKKTSVMTFGQFVKAIASFVAPLLMAWGVTQFQDWRMGVYPLFAVIAAAVILLMFGIKVEETIEEGKETSFPKAIGLLGNVTMFMLFLGIVAHVGLDAGINACAPKLLQESLGMTLEDAAFATSWYFIFRTTGCFVGAALLTKLSKKLIFGSCALFILLGIVVAGFGAFSMHSQTLIYAGIALFGFGNANIFPPIFAQALEEKPEMQNEAAGLMIMGIGGGAVIPLLMGVASDSMGTQLGALIILGVCSIYLVSCVIPKIKKS